MAKGKQGSKRGSKSARSSERAAVADADRATTQDLEASAPPYEAGGGVGAVDMQALPPPVVETAFGQSDLPFPHSELPASGSTGAADASQSSGFYAEIAPARGELRVDIDGPQPLRRLSGVISQGIAHRLHWVANVGPVDPQRTRWRGSIWYRNGTDSLLPHSMVELTLRTVDGEREAEVKFSGSATPKTRVYRRKSAYFHPVEFEFDAVEGVTPILSYATHSHPKRPAGLPSETLSIETVFRRSGFDVTVGTPGVVPAADAGPGSTWSDTEMHDAMRIYWSRFAGVAQWALWVLFAPMHDEGPTLGGIMFDSIGPQHRQGTAIFTKTFISQAPANDSAKDAWVKRMNFWCAVHEMGHAFNLAHSWQKSLGQSWIPLADESNVRSFMNYPYNVPGGQTSFFSDFAYRFSEQELLFMRHAPERFVQQGNASWFDNHAFRQVETSPEPKLMLEVRVNRPNATFEFLEPCTVELKLTNISDGPILVGERVLSDADHLVVIVKRDGDEAKRWQPFAQYCWKESNVVLDPGKSRYDSLFVGAGSGGWLLAEPGWYTIQVALKLDEEELVSNRLRVRVTPPQGYDDAYWAQDFFNEDVGSAMTFNGSRVLDAANTVMQEVVDRFPKRAVANHALVALRRPLLRQGKVMRMPAVDEVPIESAAQAGAYFSLAKSDPDAAVKGMSDALLKQPTEAAETLGHIDYKKYCDRLSWGLAQYGETKEASKVQAVMLKTLEGRKVAPKVLAEIKEKKAEYDAT